jgi:hypothetical protein
MQISKQEIMAVGTLMHELQELKYNFHIKHMREPNILVVNPEKIKPILNSLEGYNGVSTKGYIIHELSKLHVYLDDSIEKYHVGFIEKE